MGADDRPQSACQPDQGRNVKAGLALARGEAENRIGEQFELFADRASSATMPANQLRWFSAMAYVLVDSLRRACAILSSPMPPSQPSGSSSSSSALRSTHRVWSR
jgi:hypothetical protein